MLKDRVEFAASLSRGDAAKVIDACIDAAENGLFVSYRGLARLYEQADPDEYLEGAKVDKIRLLTAPHVLAEIRASRGGDPPPSGSQSRDAPINHYELDERQWVFAQEYAACGGGAAAAIRAGYSEKSARQTASRLMTNDDILRAVDDLRAASGVTHQS